MKTTGLDIIIRCVGKNEFLPIITRDGTEVYRGEFQKTAQLALGRCIDRINHMDSDYSAMSSERKSLESHLKYADHGAYGQDKAKISELTRKMNEVASIKG